MAKVVLAGDPSAAQFLNAGHSYLEAKRWLNSRELLLTLKGHNDGTPSRGFNLKYRVSVSGRVQKASQLPD